MFISSFLTLFLTIWGIRTGAQTPDTVKHSFIIDFEIRPRAEYRTNFSLSPVDSTNSEFHINQRNRVTFDYQNRKFQFKGSLQEIHLWAKNGEPSKVASINMYELFTEAKLGKYISVRAGRQGVSLDNGRIFSDAPWAQQSRAHEGIRIMQKANKISNDLLGLFTRNYSDQYDTRYSPVAQHHYKYLLVDYFKYKAGKHIILTALNSIDFFETERTGQNYQRVTTGGRVEYLKNNFYATISGYYQFGKNAALKKIQAYYLQPEIRYTTPKTTFRIGAEILSGNRSTGTRDIVKSFDILYGVAWKFMGNMNFFTRFPADVNGKGLINPYLFTLHSFNKKISLRCDFNFFATQYPMLNSNFIEMDRFLGIENDWVLKYKPRKNIEINYGFSYLLAQQEMEMLGKIKDAGKTPVWSYLMISYNPILLRRTK